MGRTRKQPWSRTTCWPYGGDEDDRRLSAYASRYPKTDRLIPTPYSPLSSNAQKHHVIMFA
jgi:hypothetical protein